ncbi:MAG: SurA N-terminal domain-containing protein [Candidatus Shapirobacteria bacterium]
MKIIKKLEKKTGLLNSLKKNQKKVNIGLAVILALLLAYMFRGQFVVATVNRQPITRLELIKSLEEQSGKQTLDNLITEKLISQEAKAKGIAISEQEINDEIESVRQRLSEQGQDLDTLLNAQGIGLAQVREQIKIQKTLEKLVGDDIQVSPEEIVQYKEENKDYLPEDQESIDGQVEESIKQEKINTAIQNLVSSLREKANISYLFDL